MCGATTIRFAYRLAKKYVAIAIVLLPYSRAYEWMLRESLTRLIRALPMNLGLRLVAKAVDILCLKCI
jgi:hypothetical protein